MSLITWLSIPELESNAHYSWNCAEQFIHRIIEPFIEKYSPLKIPTNLSRDSLYKQRLDRIFISISKSRFDFHVLRLILLACTSAGARHLIRTIEIYLDRTYFEESSVPESRNELFQMAPFADWKEFVETLQFKFLKSLPTADTSEAINNFVHAENRLSEHLLHDRCAQLRELARFSIWVSLLNEADENCPSERSASLGGLFRQLNLPTLLVNYLEFR